MFADLAGNDEQVHILGESLDQPRAGLQDGREVGVRRVGHME